MIQLFDGAGKILLGCVAALAVFASVEAACAESVLYSFCSQADCSDGSGPSTTLVADAAGNLYGTTNRGGDAAACSEGCGVVFKLAPDGTETVLHAFEGGSDGAGPVSALILDSSGNLYGTTSSGGTGTCSGGCGTIYTITSKGTEKVLYSFQGGTDGWDPQGNLVADGNGNLYGVTREGGDNFGTVFELKSGGSEAVLYTFTDRNDGAFPVGGLVRNKKGDLFGTTTWDPVYGSGTVFKLTATGQEKPLYTFTGRNDGGMPEAGLIKDGAGNLYGTTFWDGLNRDGVAFKVAPDGTETVLYSFCAQLNCTDGAYPVAGLIFDKSGNLYGTTQNGGAYNNGTVFRLATDGTETVLHSFGGKRSDGALPVSSLTEVNGYLYGTTDAGGANGAGVVFKVKR